MKNPQEATVGRHIYGFCLTIDTQMSKKWMLDEVEKTHNAGGIVTETADMYISIDGELKQFTYEEFKQRLGFST